MVDVSTLVFVFLLKEIDIPKVLYEYCAFS
jgi:hypothetical protein